VKRTERTGRAALEVGLATMHLSVIFNSAKVVCRSAAMFPLFSSYVV